jgi:4-alpha-glucanotransferase
MVTIGGCTMHFLKTTKTVVNDGFILLPATTWKGAGVSIPVFSLRSKESFGVGEFADIKIAC